MDVGTIGATFVGAVSATPDDYTPEGGTSSFVVLANTTCHLSTSGEDATTDDFMLLEGVYATIEIDRSTDSKLSWVVADTASDGEIRITAR